MRQKTVLGFILALLCTFSILFSEFNIDLRDAELYSNQRLSAMDRALNIKEAIDHQLTLNINTVDALSGLVRLNPDISQAEFVQLIEHILPPKNNAIELQLTRGTRISHISVLPDRFNSLGLDILEVATDKSVIAHNMEHRVVHIEGPFPMEGGKTHIVIIRAPIIIEDQFHGFAMYLVDFDAMIASLASNTPFALRQNQEQHVSTPFFGDPRLFENKNNILIDIPMRNQSWQLAMVFEPQLSSITFKVVVYLSSLIFTGVCSLAVYQAIKFRTLAIRDPLTAAYNRRHLHYIFDGLCAQYAMCFDIDHFKQINDRYGHDVGDQALVKFSNTIKNTIRPGDYLFRLGGEEFLVILKMGPTASDQTALEMAERIRKRVEQILFREKFSITTSIGLTRIHSEETLHQLLVRSDKLLYRAKEQGRNRTEADFPSEVGEATPPSADSGSLKMDKPA